MLTIKQEKFVQNLIKGMSQREAYKKSYNASKMKDESIDRVASRLFNKVDIKSRYDELLKKARDKSEERAIMSAIERKEWLSQVISGEIKEKTAVVKTDAEGNSKLIEQEFPSTLKTKITALDTLNKMDGQYVTNINGNLNIGYEETLKQAMSENEY